MLIFQIHQFNNVVDMKALQNNKSTEPIRNNYHTPVLLSESIDGLAIKLNGTYIDVTFGGGGHAALIMSKLGKGGRLIAFDQDMEAANNAQLLNETVETKCKFEFVHSNYRNLKRYLKLLEIEKVDGILADFGISSHQIDEGSRGFSIRFDAPLDMRMNSNDKLDAGHIVNNYREEDLQQLFSKNGEIINSKTLAQAIVKARSTSVIQTTSQLKQIALTCLRGKDFQYLAQVFQALRIEVNDELAAIEDFLQQALEVLKPGGRIVTLSYHSLEDRLVKDFFKTGNFKGEHEKDDFGKINRPFKLITKKPVSASALEIKKNNRARSVKMRIAEKI
jgi:16S rRNA (cytosine1402-N4)-methyltransferase